MYSELLKFAISNKKYTVITEICKSLKLPNTPEQKEKIKRLIEADLQTLREMRKNGI